jgi:hypothetical protein
MTNLHRHLSLLTVDVGRQDSTTCLPDPPPSPTRDWSGHPVTPPESFQNWVDFYRTLGSQKVAVFIVQNDRTWSQAPHVPSSRYLSTGIHLIAT